MRYLMTVMLSLALIACGSPDAETKADVPKVTEQQQQELIDYLKSDQEPAIKDAMFDTDKTLKISVIDDGTKRDSLASYVCMVIDERFDSKNLHVAVYDAHKIQQGEWSRLGQHLCE